MRFKKVVINPEGKSTLKLIDAETGKETFVMSGDTILDLVKSVGEYNARNAIGNIIQDNYYPNLTPEEIQEIFS